VTRPSARPHAVALADLPDRPPEIVAPAGGREQLLAALNTGADAVYLGLRRFSARARAENFTLEELRSLVPLVQRSGMKVLVTTNVVIQQAELPDLVQVLGELAELQVDALVVQDLGLARLARRALPGLRLHASTQMAVHSVQGARVAAALGFSRVVLARELTLAEIAAIRAALPPAQLELEVFCGGSLCTSYSGLCLFSSLHTGCSGNRGECVYPCRRKYQVIDGPGVGHLLSSRDLDVAGETLARLVGCGVDALKIEGRKKDAQYVASAVSLFRARLDGLWGHATSRRHISPGDVAGTAAAREQAALADLAYSFRRRTTSLFLTGRHPPPVIDPEQPTHQGVLVGTVRAVRGRLLEVRTDVPLELHDGLRLAPDEPRPAPGEEEASFQQPLRRLLRRGRPVVTAPAGSLVEIDWPGSGRLPETGTPLYKVRSADLKRRVDARLAPPAGERLRSWRPVTVAARLDAQPAGLRLQVTLGAEGTPLLQGERWAPAQRAADEPGGLPAELAGLFQVFGDAGFFARDVRITGAAGWCFPRKLLKELKRELSQGLPAAHARWQAERHAVLARFVEPGPAVPPPPGPDRFLLAVDRPENFTALLELLASGEAAFSPAGLQLQLRPALLSAEQVAHLAQAWRARPPALADLPLRLGLPAIVRDDELSGLGRLLQSLAAAGISRSYALANLASRELLQELGLLAADVSLATEPQLPTHNTETIRFWAGQGVELIGLSLEDDLANLRRLRRDWPATDARPLLILYQDVPLLVAEGCTLAALAPGCPGPARCDRRTLRLRCLDGGEETTSTELVLTHEGCRSVLLDTRPLSLLHLRPELLQAGFRDFRLDFVGRAYARDEIQRVLHAAQADALLPGTHEGNLRRGLR
jgi:putative protease